MNDFFNLPEDAVSSNNQNKEYEKKVDENLYDPNPDLSGGVYKSVIRFIPNLRNQAESKYTKYSAKIWNPVARRSIVVDCPSNENKPSVLWTLSTVLGRLYKEEPTIVKEINENFSRWYTHHSYVYVSKDPTVPANDGKIKIFKYRAQINDLIEHQLNPEEDGLVDGVSSVNPFHLLHGKDFLCVVGKKTKTWRDWTKCKFMDETQPFRFNIKGTEVVMKDDPGAIQLLQQFFDKTAPSLDEYKHVSWTDDTYKQVAEALKAAIPYKQVLDMLISETRDEKMKELLTEGSTATTTAATSSNTNSVNDLSFGGTTENNVTTYTDQNQSDINLGEPTTGDSTDSGLEGDEYDDIFKNL
jgi:hypothetical protein